ncbi:MAG: Hint domain-containing protein, partial [Paracoccaceae bacterium]
MTHATERRAGQRASRDVPAQSRGGLAQGSVVLTLDGALPIEFLTPGDRIITRNGARTLRGVDVRTLDQAPMRIAPGTLGHDRPDEALLI